MSSIKLQALPRDAQHLGQLGSITVGCGDYSALILDIIFTQLALGSGMRAF
jgi:hypothetical protein